MKESSGLRVRSMSAREKVLDAAVRLFTEVGYFNTSIPDIVRLSGVSVGSIYHHFHDKEGIARGLYDELTVRMEKHFDEIEAAHPDSIHDQCREVVRLLLRMADDEPHIMEFMIYAKHKEFLPELPPICSSKPMAHLRDIVAKGIETGVLRRVEPFVAATGIYGPTFRIIQLRMDGLVKMPVSYYFEEIWEASWRSVAA